MAIRIPDLDAAEKAAGYAFSDRRLFLRALTHPSVTAEEPALAHYQRLEFLGDAVLQFLSSRVLYAAFPEADEGALTRMRSACVSEKPLAQAVFAMGLDRFILLTSGMDKKGGRRLTSIACDVYEAVLAAIYLDGGEAEAEAYVERTIGEALRHPPEITKDAKTRLQEYLQRDGEVTIHYEELGFEGPPHDRTFFMEVRVNGESLAQGAGRSKHAAQQEAAEAALAQITGKDTQETQDAPEAN